MGFQLHRGLTALIGRGSRIGQSIDIGEQRINGFKDFFAVLAADQLTQRVIHFPLHLKGTRSFTAPIDQCGQPAQRLAAVFRQGIQQPFFNADRITLISKQGAGDVPGEKLRSHQCSRRHNNHRSRNRDHRPQRMPLFLLYRGFRGNRHAAEISFAALRHPELLRYRGRSILRRHFL